MEVAAAAEVRVEASLARAALPALVRARGQGGSLAVALAGAAGLSVLVAEDNEVDQLVFSQILTTGTPPPSRYQ